jgi:hypothetical protein
MNVFLISLTIIILFYFNNVLICFHACPHKLNFNIVIKNGTLNLMCSKKKLMCSKQVEYSLCTHSPRFIYRKLSLTRVSISEDSVRFILISVQFSVFFSFNLYIFVCRYFKICCFVDVDIRNGIKEGNIMVGRCYIEKECRNWW